ncbi:hypothetical protein I5535_17440 [Rhodobacteraceae bacterium F11138]|nr:hypothetical protein [Rhodobacteraceae bacterium F11138]
MTRHISFFLTTLLMLCAPTARAQAVDWKTIDDWRIAFYPGSQGCQAFRLYEENTAFFIGFDHTRKTGALDITILDRRWTAFKTDAEYRIRLQFGTQPAWTLDMDGVLLNGLPGLHILFGSTGPDADQFISQFRRERVMKWQHGETRLGRFPLNGSRKAFDELRRCQKHYDTTAKRPLRPVARTAGLGVEQAAAVD